MARRRNRLLQGLGEGLTNVSNLLLRTHMQDRLQERYDERAANTAAATAERAEQAAIRAKALEALMAVSKGDSDPAQAASLIAAITGKELDPSALEGVRPSPRRRMEGALGEKIGSAASPEMVPDDTTIASIATTEGLGLPSFATEGMLPSSGDADPYETAGGIAREFGQRAGARRRALMQKPTETVTGTDDSGANFTRKMSPYDLLNPFRTSPTAQQQGVLAGTEDAAKQKTVLGDDTLTTLKGKTEARIANMVEALTRQAKVETAAATAGATKRAGLAPDIVAAEVDRARQLASGNENSTESERRAATNWAPLVKAHDLATQMESGGAAIGLLDPTLSKWPVVNRAVSQKSQQYMQAARDFISTLGLIRSGVTVRPDEAEALFATMFRMEGEGDTQLRNKQRSREVFLASMQAMVGRSGDEAGRILATAINNGQISPEVLQSLQFDNEQLKRSLLDNLRIPMFNRDGTPMRPGGGQ